MIKTFFELLHELYNTINREDLGAYLRKKSLEQFYTFKSLRHTLYGLVGIEGLNYTLNLRLAPALDTFPIPDDLITTLRELFRAKWMILETMPSCLTWQSV